VKFLEVINLAKREAKGEATPEDQAWLSDPANFQSWCVALRSAITDATEQFEQQRERLDRARADVQAGILSTGDYQQISDHYEAWAKKANRYRLGLEQRLAEITTTQDSEVARLRTAIEKHRSVKQYEPSVADEVLWSVLDEV
jgi:hypothetical protein